MRQCPTTGLLKGAASRKLAQGAGCSIGAPRAAFSLPYMPAPHSVPLVGSKPWIYAAVEQGPPTHRPALHMNGQTCQVCSPAISEP